MPGRHTGRLSAQTVIHIDLLKATTFSLLVSSYVSLPVGSRVLVSVFDYLGTSFILFGHERQGQLKVIGPLPKLASMTRDPTQWRRQLRTFSGREICKQEPIPWHESHFLYSARTQPKIYFLFLLSCLLK